MLNHVKYIDPRKKILTHATHVKIMTHENVDHVTHAAHVNIWPTQPRDPRNPGTHVTHVTTQPTRFLAGSLQVTNYLSEIKFVDPRFGKFFVELFLLMMKL